MDWTNYRSSAFDELIGADGGPRPAAGQLVAYLSKLSDRDVAARQVAASAIARVSGITFTVYSDGRGIDRAWPFDVIPRVIDADEWGGIEAGLMQRLRALNRFIDDLYNDQRIVADGVFPAELLDDSRQLPAASAAACSPPFGVWAHICGSDLVRDADGTMYVLEDNLRVPSGVSATCSRTGSISKRAFADLFERQNILPVDGYTAELLEAARVDRAATRRRRPVRRGAHARHLQLGLLRALLPRPADGRRAGRGRRPRRRRRRLRLHAHDRRPAARRRDLPPHRRPVPRSRGVPPRLDARRARPDAGVAGRATSPSPTRPAPAWPTTRSSTPGCPTSSATTSARSRCCPNVPTYRCLYAEERRLRARQHRRAGASSRPTRAAATAC